MNSASPDALWLKEYTDMRHAGLVRLGTVALASVAVCTWIAFSLNAKAVGVALASNNREVEVHNGKIRQWEVERGERESKFETKLATIPLHEDYQKRIGSAYTAGRFWGGIAVVGTFGLGVGALLPRLIG